MAHISSIVYQPTEYPDGGRESDYIRVPLQSAALIANHGIEGDMKAGHHPERQLNVLSQEWLNRAAAQGYRTAPGQFGEQMIITGMEVVELASGTRLQLGDQAVIEVVKGRTGCTRFEAAQGKKIGDLGALGILARVITTGTVAVGDPVKVVESVSARS